MKKINTALIISFIVLISNPVMGENALTEISPINDINHIDSVKNTINEMRKIWRSNFIPSSEMSTELLKNYREQLNQVSEKLWVDANKEGIVEKLWSDTLLDDSTQQGRIILGQTLNNIYQRLFVLAKSYETIGTNLYKDPRVKNFLINTLTILNQRYYHNNSPEWGNWWHWEIGISRTVNNILVILYDDLPYDLINSYNQATRHFVNNPRFLAEGSGAPYSTTKNVFISTGGNRIDSAQVVFVRGLLANNSQEISAAVSSLPEVLNMVDNGDGFYADGSFIQHKDLPYNGTYGQVLLNGFGLIKRTITNTPWDFSPQENLKIYQIIHQSYLPLMYQGKMTDAVNGRSIARSNGQDLDVGYTMLNALALFVDGAPSQQRKILEEQLKSQLVPDVVQNYQTKLPDNLAAYQVINRLIAQHIESSKEIPRGTIFADMDRVVYRGSNYMAVVAMHSNRTGSYECINGENLKGQRTSDGMTYLYLKDKNQYTGYWPNVDARYLPGTTSAGELGSCDEQYRLSQLGHANIIWAGGVALKEWASAGLDLKVPKTSLTAKKSWFMAPDIIIMLGSDISASEPPITTIANRKLLTTDSIEVDDVALKLGEQRQATHVVKLNDGKNAIRWELDGNSKIDVQLSKRQGDWADIGTSTGKTSAPFLTILNKHLTNSDENYQYAIYPTNAPNISFSILANNKLVQAIRFTDSHTVMANFWRPTKIETVEAITPLSLIISPSEENYHIAVSSPRRDSRVSFRLSESLRIKSDPGSRVTIQNGIISIDMRQLRGSSYVFELQK